MSKMGWLHYLVQQASQSKNDEELKKHLKTLGFKNPNIASREFIKAYEDLEEKAAKVGIKSRSGYSIWISAQLVAIK